jgi:uncharacterized protein YggE
MDIENRLRISGHAATKVVPDRARWTVTVRVEEQDRDAAFRRCATARRGLVAKLNAIERGCVTAGRIAIAEELETYYVVTAELRQEVVDQLKKAHLPKGITAQIGERIGEQQRRRRCFAATATLGVDVAVAKAGAVPQLLVAEDVAWSSGPVFEISKREEIGDELRAKAVDNARSRAGRLADAAGRRLGRALVISDLDESLASLTGAVRRESSAPKDTLLRAFRSAAPAPGTGTSVAAEEAPIVMEITPEPVELSETMTVVFELVDRV